MSKPTEAEILREARRVLRVLAAEHTTLVRLNAADFVIGEKARERSKAFKVGADIVAEFRKRGWLSPAPAAEEAYALSDAGLGWHLRDAARQDPFAAQHRVMVAVAMQTEEGERIVAMNEAESTLGRLRHYGTLDAVQFAAGERLRRDFTIAQLSPRLGVDYSAPALADKRSGAPELNLTDAVLAAKRRFSAALKAVGPGLADLLFDVCCHLQGLEEAERDNGWPRRSAKVVLGIALDRLALHYGLRATAPLRGRIRSWATPEIFSG